MRIKVMRIRNPGFKRADSFAKTKNFRARCRILHDLLNGIRSYLKVIEFAPDNGIPFRRKFHYPCPGIITRVPNYVLFEESFLAYTLFICLGVEEQVHCYLPEEDE
jgi:hypothetical protein